MRFFLQVPYQARQQAKALGARWDPQAKKWYVFSEAQLKACRRWATSETAEPSDSLEVSTRKQRYAQAMRDYVEREEWLLKPKGGHHA